MRPYIVINRDVDTLGTAAIENQKSFTVDLAVHAPDQLERRTVTGRFESEAVEDGSRGLGILSLSYSRWA